jgi:DNA ligase-associated metallophosphoesterase
MIPFPGSISITFAGEQCMLLPDRAVFWARKQTAIVADVHLGKSGAFRKAGLPVPSGATARDLRRLDTLLRLTSARRLVVLGDFIHARSSHDPALWDAVSTWRHAHVGVSMLLVRGNHDRSAGRIRGDWNIDECEEPFDDGEILFSHIPRYDAPRPTLAGHVHPVVAIRDFDRSKLRVPCFVVDEGRCAILPAFGSFTGGQPVDRAEGRQLLMVSGTRVVRVP